LRTSRLRASLALVSKRGNLRASDEDREAVIDRLRKAATEGRIGSDELEQRVSEALKARTSDELEAIVADLPKAGHRTPSYRRSAGGWAVSTIRANPILLLFAIPVVAVTAAMVLAATLVWTLLVIVFLVVGRHSIPRGPWMYGRRYGQYAWRYGPPRYRPGPHGARPRRGPGSYWA
jgi:hypothetical protein